MVGIGGLEPPTSRLSGVRSNHLSYTPTFQEFYFITHRVTLQTANITNSVLDKH